MITFRVLPNWKIRTISLWNAIFGEIITAIASNS